MRYTTELCWEFLDNIRLTKYLSPRQPGGKLAIYKGVAEYKMISNYIEFEECKICQCTFVKHFGSKRTICSKECSLFLREFNKKLEKIRKYRSNVNKIKKPAPKKPRQYYLEKQKKSNPKLFRIKTLLRHVEIRAKKRKMSCNLTRQWLLEQTQYDKCQATDIVFNYSSYKKNPFSPSIDRIDNKKGYTQDNCRVVIWAFNCAKQVFTDTDLYIMCKALVS